MDKALKRENLMLIGWVMMFGLIEIQVYLRLGLGTSS